MYGHEARAYRLAMQSASDLLERLDALAARASDAERRGLELGELEDMLSVGYAGVLSGEARMRRHDEPLDELERAVARLRAALARLQVRFVALGGAAPRS
jgi:hypothetical protein